MYRRNACLLAVAVLAGSAYVLPVAAADEGNTEMSAFQRMCGEYQRMMDHSARGMRERWRRWWNGDSRPQFGAVHRFRSIDENHDGIVSAEEASANVESVFAAMDQDDNDELTLDEFMSIRMGRGPGMNTERQARRQEMKKARFAALDADNNERLSRSEFMAAERERFAAADTDNDGKVTPWEFRSIRQIY